MGKTELTEKFDRRENLRGTALTIMGGIFWGLAGVFGKYIHATSAMSFGLLQSYPDKIEFIGNAAGNGAARALFDADFVKNTEKLTEEIRHIELADENDFQNKFLNAMELKEWYYR